MARQVIHIILSMALLVSTMGISIRSHYCMGELRFSTLVFWKTSCCENPDDMPLDCCMDFFDHYQVDDDFQFNFLTSLPEIEWEGHSFAQEGPLLIPEIYLFDRFYQNYKPPLITRDVPVFIQSFLI